MVRLDGFHFGTVCHNDQRAIAIDLIQQTLDERLCGRIAPVRILKQEQDGGAVLRCQEERGEAFKACILALRSRHLGL